MYSKDSHFTKPKDAAKLNVVLKKFEEHCTPRKKNHIMAVLKFNERRQGDNESFDVRNLVKDCVYQEEQIVRYVIVFRCKYPKCVRSAWTKQPDEAIKIGQNYETNLSSLKKLASAEDPTVNSRNQEKCPLWNCRRST